MNFSEHATPASPDLAIAFASMGMRARNAARELVAALSERKDAWLHALAAASEQRTPELLDANASDLAAAEGQNLTAAMFDRLRLTPARVQSAAKSLRQVAALPDPVGRVIEGSVRPNGLRIEKIGVPLGVILFLYESRPNVTLDAAALAVKSGNAIILRGGKEAIHTNMALYRLLHDELIKAGLPTDAVQVVDTTDRAAVGCLLKLHAFIDVVIPRGGHDLIERVSREATMPVLKHYRGNCHVFVDRSANVAMATRIIVNAKCQRPGVCNAAESLLVHREIAELFLPTAAEVLRDRGVEIRGCERTCDLISFAKQATEDDFAAEFLELILSVKIVNDFEDAVDHIHRHGSGHTEAIVTEDLRTAERFATLVDASAVMINASTRFNDGFELGLGAEIGISTDKLHARGPCGLRELTSYKYVVHGDGHVREEGGSRQV